ncbi:MAG: ribose 5-phosphate isomerase A, partial [Melioribacteraceae bacterium]|nr:ribose 5-phosphate isomerase A [Melioribacteraceae bacterium]
TAGEKAVEEIQSGMTIGLGSGSTVYHTILKIGEAIKSGKLQNIRAIPSSDHTESVAKKVGIPMVTFKDYQSIDLTIDGADEVDENLNLIKGGGAAHLREKVLVQISEKFVVVIDESKLSKNLGEKWSVPLEVIKFAFPAIARFVENNDGIPILRKSKEDKPVITDEGNYIIDANFGVIHNPFQLAEKLESKAGIVEHGLFLNLASKIIVAGEEGLKIIEKSSSDF